MARDADVDHRYVEHGHERAIIIRLSTHHLYPLPRRMRSLSPFIPAGGTKKCHSLPAQESSSTSTTPQMMSSVLPMA